MIEMPTFCRLEYLTPDGWVKGHGGINLLHPDRYVERLAANRKFGRAIELGPDLQPTGRVWEPDPADLPDPEALRPSSTQIPRLPDPGILDLCLHCDEFHREPFDGTCLL